MKRNCKNLLFDAKPEVIYIEATGAAHPVEVLDAVMSPIFVEQLTFKGIITIVDGKRWLDRKNLSPQIQQLLVEQVKYANLILINKTDTCSPGDQAKLKYGNEYD